MKLFFLFFDTTIASIQNSCILAESNKQTNTMTTVTLKMWDEFNEVNVERTIDGSNVLVANSKASWGWECHVIGTDKQIEDSLNAWISERGNKQHDTLLTLRSWAINKS